MRALRGRVSGLCQPEYVLDIPGGHGKSPIGPNYLCEERRAATASRTSTALCINIRRRKYLRPLPLRERAAGGSTKQIG